MTGSTISICGRKAGGAASARHCWPTPRRCGPAGCACGASRSMPAPAPSMRRKVSSPSASPTAPTTRSMSPTSSMHGRPCPRPLAPCTPARHDPRRMTDPTRDAAFDLLSAVLDRRRSLEDALDALPAMEARDRSAGHRLAAAVLRRAGTLDAVMEPFLKKAPPDKVRNILRIGAAGLLLLDTPAHAAVATAVGLARSRGLLPFAGLVNAVLPRAAGGRPGAPANLRSTPPRTPPPPSAP